MHPITLDHSGGSLDFVLSRSSGGILDDTWLRMGRIIRTSVSSVSF